LVGSGEFVAILIVPEIIKKSFVKILKGMNPENYLRKLKKGFQF